MTINQEKMAEIAQKTPTSEDFFTYAAERKRNVREGVSRLTQIRQQMEIEGYHPIPQDLLSTFRELERAGIGTLKGDKFHWSFPIKKVGAAVFGPKAKTIPSETVAVGAPPAPKTRSIVMFFSKTDMVSVDVVGHLTKDQVSLLVEKLLQECR